MAGSSPLPRLFGNQEAASHPARNVWLSASAGTGKTQVLSARVFRLLLRGVDPGAILCLTFTKAGAAEMAHRISSRLAHWVRANSLELRSDLAALGETASPDLIERARTLFASVLDAPGGGIRIQTIHSFCQSLLSAFPLEAGLVPGFRPLEGREEAVLAREALADMLVAAEREGRSGPVEAVGALSLRLGEGKAEAYLRECARAGEALAELPIAIQPWLRRTLELPSGDIAEELARCCTDAAFDVAGLRLVAAANRGWGTATGANHAEIVEYWLDAAPAERPRLLADLVGVFRTTKGEARKATQRLLDIEPDYALLAEALGARCAELVALQARADYADLLARALDAGRDYARSYAEAKRRAGAVDFDDLIRSAVKLLEQPGMGDWVRYKLDQATEHVLIDEAQDTNWKQWTIVRAIADEFFAGEGVRGEGMRTLFTVGDYKQAIFGFQGTDPYYFALAHRHFERLAAAASAFDRYEPVEDQPTSELQTLSLTQSFRSTRPVLEFVDAALAGLPEHAMGEHSAAEPHASEVAGPGRVILLPVVTDEAGEAEEEGWIGDATRKLAGEIARRIKRAIGSVTLRDGRMLGAGDVMVLVKRRGDLASLIVARLYAEGVPVAGVDRLRLNAPLAVQDLLAAVRFALQPEDDLSLAALLVSPLVGWSQERLMAAAMRSRGSLWRHLRSTQDDVALAPLLALLARADIATPYRFVEEILSGPLDGRRKLLLRLGEEARDPIEELLSAALTFETRATPSLQRFLDWFDRGDVEIVRDAAQPQDAVRVMTAHGAKGLQAPMVILADATADPNATRRDFLLWKPEAAGGELPIFRPRGSERGGPLDAALAESDRRELEEHWRLFYVAATRAEEQLVIAGAAVRGKPEPPAASWYAACARAFDALGVAQGEERVFSGVGRTSPAKAAAKPAAAAPIEVALPPWLRTPAPVEARPPRPLAPSSLGEDQVADPPPTPAMRAAAERGRLLHALFERLPAVSPVRRPAAAERWLESSAGVTDAALRAELADAALRVIADPRLAELFGAEALAEAPITAVLPDGLVVSGTVDRLLVEPHRIRLVDFKTGRRAPATLDDVPSYHLRQVAAYAAALAVIFPDRPIEAALLYTAGPTLFALPDDLLARHKPGYPDTEQSLASSA